jgi:hypothetical protein
VANQHHRQLVGSDELALYVLRQRVIVEFGVGVHGAIICKALQVCQCVMVLWFTLRSGLLEAKLRWLA